MPLPDFRLAPNACPFCGAVHDAATAFAGFHGPEPGDAMLCWTCGAWAVYTASLTRRPPTSDEVEQIAADPGARVAWLGWLAWHGQDDR